MDQQNQPRHSTPSLHAIFHYNTHTHDLITKSIAEGHDHLTRFFTTWFMCQFLDMGLNTPGAWVDMHSSIVTLGEWERQKDSRWAPPAKNWPLSVVLEVGVVTRWTGKYPCSFLGFIPCY